MLRLEEKVLANGTLDDYLGKVYDTKAPMFLSFVDLAFFAQTQFYLP